MLVRRLIYQMIQTLLNSLQRKAEWRVGRIQSLPASISSDFVVGEEVLYLVLGENEQVLIHKMPRLEKTTDVRGLNTRMIRHGLRVPPECIIPYEHT